MLRSSGCTFYLRKAIAKGSNGFNAQGKMLAGTYWSTRRSVASFASISGLAGQITVSLNADGTIQTPSSTGDPKDMRWREVGPYLWEAVDGSDRLSAVIKDGRVQHFQFESSAPVSVYQPVPFSKNAGLSIAVLAGSLIILLLTFLAWPVRALVCKVRKRDHSYAGAALSRYRLTNGFAGVAVFAFLSFALIFILAGTYPAIGTASFDPVLRVVQLLFVLILIGAVIAILQLWKTIGSAQTSWLSKLWAGFITVAFFGLAWTILNYNLLSSNLNY